MGAAEAEEEEDDAKRTLVLAHFVLVISGTPGPTRSVVGLPDLTSCLCPTVWDRDNRPHGPSMALILPTTVVVAARVMVMVMKSLRIIILQTYGRRQFHVYRPAKKKGHSS